MKIIGETKGGFILEASKDEIANLKGFYSYHQTPKESEPKVDDSIEVEKIYDRYRAFERIIKSNDFRDALNRIKDTVAVLTPVQELFSQTNEVVK